MDHEEHQYLALLRKIRENGWWEEGRNGRTCSLFGETMRFSLAGGRMPILTTKKMAWKTCLKELLWFVRGETDNAVLKRQGVHIWDANGSRSFLDSRGLTHYEVDELGPVYGHQWRHFNKPYHCKRENKLEEQPHAREEGVDQLQSILRALRDPVQRTSRRLVMSAWNPCQLSQMALPPCHVLCQFNVHDGNKLSCAMYQRSADFFLGAPFNIASYAFLTHLIAHHCGLEAHEFVYFIGNCHLYENAVEASVVQSTREPHPFPILSIRTLRENIEDYEVDDFVVQGYVSHDPIKVDMIA